MPSFDVVSKVDMQEVDNAVNQTRKEIQTRYDFRGSKTELTIEEEEAIMILADDNMKLNAVVEILKAKIAKRNVGVRALDFQEPERAGGDMLRQKVAIKQGISTDDGKKIAKQVKELGMKKVQAQIQGDQVRVTGPKRDDLQVVMKAIREKTDLELQFVNFKE